MPNGTRAPPGRLRALGATTASPWRLSRRSGRRRTRASASSRRSSTPTAWRRPSGGGRRSSSPTATSTGFWDDALYPPPGAGLPSEGRLGAAAPAARHRRKLDDVEVDGKIAGRFYQARAIRRVGESFERDARRKALLVMATGSGKTRTVVALVDQLMRGESGCGGCCSSPTGYGWCARRTGFSTTCRRRRRAPTCWSATTRGRTTPPARVFSIPSGR
ncbi:MAG: DEAD/DEAH box helicase family protein [Amaricoccus sp.]